MTLVSVTAYHSFGGEVEALNTPTIRRLTPSCRHQLPRIALLWEGFARGEILTFAHRRLSPVQWLCAKARPSRHLEALRRRGCFYFLSPVFVPGSRWRTGGRE